MPKFVTTVKFFMWDTAYATKKTSTTLENYSSVILNTFVKKTGYMCKKDTVEFGRDVMRSACGYTLIMELITEHDFTTDTKNNFFNTALDNSLKELGLNERLTLKKSIEMKSALTNATNAVNFEYKGKIAKNSLSYDALGFIEKTTNEYFNEYGWHFADQAYNTYYGRDASGRVIETRYKYHALSPKTVQNDSVSTQALIEKTKPKSKISDADLKNLINESSGYIANPKDRQLLTESLQAQNFNQALRRACAAENIDLVNVLIKYNQNFQLKIDFNEPTGKGEYPLDLATKNQTLVEILKQHGATRSKIGISSNSTLENKN